MAISKEIALDAIRQFAGEANLTREEVYAALGGDITSHDAKEAQPAFNDAHHLTLGDVFTYVGAIIVVLGISVLLQQNWADFGTVARLTLTLLLGAAFYGVATYLQYVNRYEHVANAFQVIGAYGMAIGVAVLLDTLSLTANYWAWAAGAGALTAIYIVSDYLLKRVALSLLSVLFSTTLLWALVAAIQPIDAYSYAYMFVVTGISYVSLAFAWVGTRRGALTNVLATFGAFYALGAGFVLMVAERWGGMWTLLVPGLIAAGMYCSVKIHAGGMFVVSLLFMLGYIAYITGRYFATTIGWPFALMAAGLLMIAAGYYAVSYRNKHLRAPAKP